MAELHPKIPVTRHLIGIEWLKIPTQEEELEDEMPSSSASWWSPLLTNCRRLFPDFFLESPPRRWHRGEGRRDGVEPLSLPWMEMELGFGSEKSDLNFSGRERTVLFKNWTIRNWTSLRVSPSGVQKSGSSWSIRSKISGVYTSDVGHPSQCPWLISVRASAGWIRSVGKFISWKNTLCYRRFTAYEKIDLETCSWYPTDWNTSDQMKWQELM